MKEQLSVSCHTPKFGPLHSPFRLWNSVPGSYSVFLFSKNNLSLLLHNGECFKKKKRRACGCAPRRALWC